MRPLTLSDFYEAEGSTLSPPDPEDEPLPDREFPAVMTEERRRIDELKEEAGDVTSNDNPIPTNDSQGSEGS